MYVMKDSSTKFKGNHSNSRIAFDRIECKHGRSLCFTADIPHLTNSSQTWSIFCTQVLPNLFE